MDNHLNMDFHSVGNGFNLMDNHLNMDFHSVDNGFKQL